MAFAVIIIALAIASISSVPTLAQGEPDLSTYPLLFQRQDASTPSTPLSILMVGDTSMARDIKATIATHGFDYPLSQTTSYLQAADISSGNYEGPIVTPGIGKERSGPAFRRFRADPEAAPALKRAGFKLFTLANNHTMDWGPAGLADTILHLHDAGLWTIGAGENGPAARRPLITEVKGVRIAWIGYTIIPDLPNNDRDREDSWTRAWIKSATDPSDLINAVKDARTQADLVIVQFHWGLEYQPCPQNWQIFYARKLIDAGAALVVGHHPHVAQSIEQYHGGLIAYSLGNFLFDEDLSPGLGLWIRADKSGVIDVHGLSLHPGIVPVWRTGTQSTGDFDRLCRIYLPTATPLPMTTTSTP